MASIRVDFPLPFSPTRNVTQGGSASSPRRASHATAGRLNGYRPDTALQPSLTLYRNLAAELGMFTPTDCAWSSPPPDALPLARASGRVGRGRHEVILRSTSCRLCARPHGVGSLNLNPRSGVTSCGAPERSNAS